MSEMLPGTTADLIKRLFSRGEAFDAEGFLTFFTDHPIYQFGNFDICFDKVAMRKSADYFFSQINAVYHEIKMMWEVGDVAFVEMDVHYWRKDNSFVSLPCFDIFRVEGDKFSELRIFMDVNPVFDPSIPVPDTASVFIESQGKRLTPPEVMKHHFSSHPEGVQRVKTGYAPKWISSGPQWSLNDYSATSAPTSKSKIDLVMDMEMAGGAFNWDYFKTFFVDDVFFKVGASEEMSGWQSIAEYLKWLYSIAEPMLPFEFRGTWEFPDAVIVEMDAKYKRRSDGKPIKFPCTDIIRFDRNNKINEWRVYPDQSELWMEQIKTASK